MSIEEGAETHTVQIMGREFPWLQLNVQHRMHDELYAHLIACVYKSDIDSRYSTNNPSPFLQNLLAHPTQVIAGSNYYELRSFLHFIDVEHGKQESEEGASSWNTLEVNAVDALVKALIERPGIEKGSIGVLTGYRAQKKLLRRKARDNGWGSWTDVCIDTKANMPLLIRSLD